MQKKRPKWTILRKLLVGKQSWHRLANLVNVAELAVRVPEISLAAKSQRLRDVVLSVIRADTVGVVLIAEILMREGDAKHLPLLLRLPAIKVQCQNW